MRISDWSSDVCSSDLADALDALRTRLLPMATVLTPNTPEAELLLGRTIDDGAAADEAVLALRALGAGAVLLKGGHLHEGDTVTDRYADNATTARWPQTRMEVNGHGHGRPLQSAVAAHLFPGRPDERR